MLVLDLLPAIPGLTLLIMTLPARPLWSRNLPRSFDLPPRSGPRWALLPLPVPAVLSLTAGWIAIIGVGSVLTQVALAIAVTLIPASLLLLQVWTVLDGVRRTAACTLVVALPATAAVVAALTCSSAATIVVASVLVLASVAGAIFCWRRERWQTWQTWLESVDHRTVAPPATSMPPAAQQQRGHRRTDSYLSERSDTETTPEWSFRTRRDSQVCDMSHSQFQSQTQDTRRYSDPTQTPRSAATATTTAGKHCRTPSTPYAEYSVLASYSPNPHMPLPRGFESITSFVKERSGAEVEAEAGSGSMVEAEREGGREHIATPRSARMGRKRVHIATLPTIPGTPVLSPTPSHRAPVVHEYPRYLWILAAGCILVFYILTTPILVQRNTPTQGLFTAGMFLPSSSLAVAIYYRRHEVSSSKSSTSSISVPETPRSAGIVQSTGDISFDIEAQRYLLPRDLFPLPTLKHPAAFVDSYPGRHYPFHAYALDPFSSSLKNASMRRHTVSDDEFAALMRRTASETWLSTGHARDLGSFGRMAEMMRPKPALCVLDSKAGVVSRMRGGVVSMIAPRGNGRGGEEQRKREGEEGIAIAPPRNSQHSPRDTQPGRRSTSIEIEASIEIATRARRSQSPSFIVTRQVDIMRHALQRLINVPATSDVDPRSPLSHSARHVDRSPFAVSLPTATPRPTRSSVPRSVDDVAFRPSIDHVVGSTPRRPRLGKSTTGSSVNDSSVGIDFSRPYNPPTIDYTTPRRLATTIIDLTSSTAGKAEESTRKSIRASASAAFSFLEAEDLAWSHFPSRSSFVETVGVAVPISPVPTHAVAADMHVTRAPMTPQRTTADIVAHLDPHGCSDSPASITSEGVAEMERVLSLDTPARWRYISEVSRKPSTPTPTPSVTASMSPSMSASDMASRPSDSLSHTTLDSSESSVQDPQDSQSTHETQSRTSEGATTATTTTATSTTTSTASSVYSIPPPLPPLPSFILHGRQAMPYNTLEHAFIASSESLHRLMAASPQEEEVLVPTRSRGVLVPKHVNRCSTGTVTSCSSGKVSIAKSSIPSKASKSSKSSKSSHARTRSSTSSHTTDISGIGPIRRSITDKENKRPSSVHAFPYHYPFDTVNVRYGRGRAGAVGGLRI